MNAASLYKIRQALLALAAVYEGRHRREFEDLLEKLYRENVEMVTA